MNIALIAHDKKELMSAFALHIKDLQDTICLRRYTGSIITEAAV
jgi:methylglyoxal synthase